MLHKVPQMQQNTTSVESSKKSMGFVRALDAAAQGQKDIVCIVLLVCGARSYVPALEK